MPPSKSWLLITVSCLITSSIVNAVNTSGTDHAEAKSKPALSQASPKKLVQGEARIEAVAPSQLQGSPSLKKQKSVGHNIPNGSLREGNENDHGNAKAQFENVWELGFKKFEDCKSWHIYYYHLKENGPSDKTLFMKLCPWLEESDWKYGNEEMGENLEQLWNGEHRVNKMMIILRKFFEEGLNEIEELKSECTNYINWYDQLVMIDVIRNTQKVTKLQELVVDYFEFIRDLVDLKGGSIKKMKTTIESKLKEMDKAQVKPISFIEDLKQALDELSLIEKSGGLMAIIKKYEKENAELYIHPEKDSKGSPKSESPRHQAQLSAAQVPDAHSAPNAHQTGQSGHDHDNHQGHEHQQSPPHGRNP